MVERGDPDAPARAALTGDGGEPQSHGQRGYARLAARGGIVTAAGFALTQIITIVGVLVHGNLATKEQYGTFVIGAVFANLATVFAESGLHSALVQWRGDVEKAANSVLLATLASGVGLTLLGLALAPLLGAVVGRELVTQIALATAGILLLRAASVTPDALMQRRFSFARQVIVPPLMALMYAVVTAVLLAAGYGAWSFVFGLYASQLTGTGISWSLVNWRPHPRLASVPVWRQLARFGSHTLFARVVAGFRDEIETLAVGGSLGVGSAGAFRYARRLATLPGMAAVSVGAYVLLPVFSRIAADEERLRAAFLRTGRWIATIAFPPAFLFLALGDSMVHVALPAEWAEAGPALTAMFCFGIGESMISLSIEATRAIGRPELTSRLALFVLITAPALLFALLPFGIIGVSIAVSSAALLAGLYALGGAIRRIGVSPGELWRSLRPPLVASMAMAAVVSVCDLLIGRIDELTRPQGLIVLVVEVLIGVVVFAGVLVALAPGVVNAVRGLGSGLRRLSGGDD